MKKTLLIAAFSLLNLAANCQDTIFLKDGTMILARILNETQETVHYKSWTNQEGPSWSKSRNNVAYIHYSKSMPVTTDETLDFITCDEPTAAKRTTDCPTGNSIVAAIDKLYKDGNAEQAIKQYVHSLPPCIQRKCLYSHFLGRYQNTCTTGVAERIIRDGEIYVYIGADDENVPAIMTTLAKLYARQGDSLNATRWIDRLEKFSRDNDDMFDADVAKLRVSVDGLLHPVPPEEAYNGTWVMIEDKLEWSPYIIKINGITEDCRARFIQPEPKVEFHGEKNGLYSYQPVRMINYSQGIQLHRENNNSIIMQFASQDVVDLTPLAQDGQRAISGINQIAGQSIQLIQSSNNSAGVRYGGEIAVSLAATAANALIAFASTYAFSYINAYNFSFSLPDNNTMWGFMRHTEGRAYNDGRVKGEKNDTSIVQFVRWEPSDNVVFASKDKRHKKPITCVPILNDDDPMLAEFNSIQRKHTFWQPKYAIPEFVGSATCLGMFAGGVVCLSNDNVAVGAPLLVTGLLGSFANLIVPATVAKHRRNNAFEAMNKRGYDILRDKAGWTPPPVKEEKDVYVNEIRELKKLIKTDEALKAEYDQIVHRNRFGQAKYLVPFIGGTTATLTMVIIGGTLYKGTPRGILLPVFGGYGMVASIIVPPIVCTHRKNKQLRKLYHQHFDPKDNAPEVGFSMTPCYTPENKGYGLSFTMNF